MKKVEVIKVDYPNNVGQFPVAKERVGLDKDDERNYYLVKGKPVLKHGQFEIHFPNGKLWNKGCYRNGLRVGAHQHFTQEGSFFCREFYKSNGEAIYREYYDKETGKLIRKEYRSGKELCCENYHRITGELMGSKYL